MKNKLLLLLLVFANGFSQNAVLDTTFGINGKVTTSLTLAATYIGIKSTEIQSDGKILACGNINNLLRYVLTRYNHDGTLDTTFGNQGMVINNDFFQIRYSKMKLQSDGKIIVVSQRRINETVNVDILC